MIILKTGMRISNELSVLERLPLSFRNDIIINNYIRTIRCPATCNDISPRTAEFHRDMPVTNLCLNYGSPSSNRLSLYLYWRLRAARVTRSGIPRRFPVMDRWHRVQWFRRWRLQRTVVFRRFSPLLEVSLGQTLSCDQTRLFSPVMEGRTFSRIINYYNY